MGSVSINELQSVTGHDDDGDNDDEHVTHDQAIDILEREPVPKQQILTNAEGGIDVLNDNMEHANVDQEMNASCSENTETHRRANVGKVKRKIFNN